MEKIIFLWIFLSLPMSIGKANSQAVGEVAQVIAQCKGATGRVTLVIKVAAVRR